MGGELLLLPPLPQLRSGRSGRSPVCGVRAVGELARSRAASRHASARRGHIVSAAASQAAPPPRHQSRRASPAGLIGLRVTLSSVRSRAFRRVSSHATHGSDEGAGSERRRLIVVGAPRGDVGAEPAGQARADAANPDDPVLHRRRSTGGVTRASL